MKPLIGLTSYYVESAELGSNRPRGSQGQDLMIATADYSKSVERAGGIPMILPCTHDPSMIKAYVARVDGLIFCGGEDIVPTYYNQPYKRGIGVTSPIRDAFEWALLEEAIQQKKPIFGICRGLQLINIYYGGTVFQDLNQMDFTAIEHSCTELPRYVACHETEVYVNTQLYDILQQGKIMVNTKHHQSIDVLGKGLIVSAKAMDGVIEGIEDPEKPFLLAVQWHPEMMSEVDDLQQSIFNGFIKKCK
jgi:putative glutamine amidotransferase